VGQLVRHLRFGYRGVVFDVNEEFEGSDTWYEQVARSRPPRDRPWYHVIVHDAEHTTYVADRHLEADASAAPVDNPLVASCFDRFEDGRYVPRELQ
jgi:heat shock protein HspQ